MGQSCGQSGIKWQLYQKPSLNQGLNVRSSTRSLSVRVCLWLRCSAFPHWLGLMWSHVLSSTLWWCWWSVMHCPSIVLGLLTPFLLFFLLTIDDLDLPHPSSSTSLSGESNPAGHHCSTHFLVLHLLTLLIGCCGWPFTLLLDMVVPMMHVWIFACPNPGFYFYFVCLLNMLGMFCVRTCSGLMGLRAAPRVRSLHSFPGITVAQVGLWWCVCVCLSCNIM